MYKFQGNTNVDCEEGYVICIEEVPVYPDSVSFEMIKRMLLYKIS